MSQNALREIVLVTREDTVADFEDTVRIIRSANVDISIELEDCISDIELKEGVLVITDLPEVARQMISLNVPVLGCLTEKNREHSFEGVRFLYYQEEGFDRIYPERVYRRYLNLPWNILETNRCLVRETTEEDLEAFYEIYKHPSITRYMEPLFSDKEKEYQYITSYRKNVYEFYEFGIWTVILKESGDIIGRAGLTMREGFDEPELGFVIGHPWQGEGYGYEVCKAILQYGLSEFGFHKVQAFSQPQNHASLALLYKLGFRHVDENSIDGIEHERWDISL